MVPTCTKRTLRFHVLKSVFSQQINLQICCMNNRKKRWLLLKKSLFQELDRMAEVL
jgi:hypothetical protein